MTLVDELRSRTQSYHRQLEASAYSRALAAGEVALESYVGHLRAMAVIHAALERNLDLSTSAHVRSVWGAGVRRLPALESDLVFFQKRNIPDIPDAVANAFAIAQKVRLRSQEDPDSLLGYLFVLEGSMKGATVLRLMVERTFHFTAPEGLCYLSAAEVKLGERWKHFAERLDGLNLEKASADSIVSAACELFESLMPLFGALHPFQKETLRFSASSLNPEAGTHAVPSDPQELSAALRAGELCWQRFPYFKIRYGDRGKRFTSSDSAWLVTLAQDDQAIVNQQVLWLGRVLSARGIPRYLLECQLQILSTELSKTIPEKAGQYEKLAVAARILSAARTNQISQARLESLGNEFEKRVSPDTDTPFMNAGEILVAAVADEKDGIAEAAASIVTWFMENAHVSDAYRGDVKALAEEARRVP